MHVKQELFESGHATHFPLGLSISTTKHLHSSAKICNWKECNISVLCRHPAALKPYGTDPVPLIALKSRGYMIKKFFFGEAPPWGLTLYRFFDTVFERKATPLNIPSMGTRFPFHIPSLKLLRGGSPHFVAQLPKKARSILIDVLECFFRVKGLAFVHYTCYRDGKKNTSISSIRRIQGEREPRTDREKSTLFELSWEWIFT